MAEADRMALVLEGGGMRGIFTSGVLDVMQEKGIYGFGSVWGVSAGALNAAAFKSRQIGRNMRVMLAYRDDRRLMSFFSLALTGDIAGVDFLYDEVQNKLDPFDNETFNANPMRMYVVVSDVDRGEVAYLACRSFPQDVVKVRASASLPLFSRIVEVDGRRYLDGGTMDSVPYRAALGLKGAKHVKDHKAAERAVVVLTRERGYVKGGGIERLALLSHRYDNFTAYAEALKTRPERYNAQREELYELESEGRLLVIEPPQPVEISSTEHDGGKLLQLYLQGRKAASDKLDELQAWAG